MSTLFVTGDLHFNHQKMIKLAGRPVDDVYEMNNFLMKRWNERVKPSDKVIINGDFCYKSKVLSLNYFLENLNGEKIFIKGNHDEKNGLRCKVKSLVVEFANMEIFITHNPQDCNKNFDLNITAHVHEAWKWKPMDEDQNKILINCGVDVWSFHPVKISEIVDLYNKIKKESNNERN